MSSCHPTVFLIKAGSSLIIDQVRDNVEIDMIAYQCLIGKLLYLTYGTRPDIVFVMGQLNCYNSDPRVSHIYITNKLFNISKE